MADNPFGQQDTPNIVSPGSLLDVGGRIARAFGFDASPVTPQQNQANISAQQQKQQVNVQDITGQFQSEVLKLMQGGLGSSAASMQVLNSPLGDEFLHKAPGAIFDTVQNLRGFDPAPPPDPISTNPGDVLVERDASGAIVPVFENPRIAPTDPASVMLVNEIQEAQAAGDTERVRLLSTNLPKGPDNRLSVSDYITMRALNVPISDANTPAGVRLTQEQAIQAQSLAQASTAGRAPSDIDLLLIGLGVKPGEEVPVEVAQAAAIIRDEQKRREGVPGFLAGLGAQIKAQSGLPGADVPEVNRVEDTFKAFNEGRDAGTQEPAAPRQPAEVPISEPTAPLATPQVGGAGPAARSSAPRLAPSPEEIAKLSDADARALGKSFVDQGAGLDALTQEQQDALIARLSQIKAAGGRSE